MLVISVMREVQLVHGELLIIIYIAIALTHAYTHTYVSVLYYTCGFARALTKVTAIIK